MGRAKVYNSDSTDLFKISRTGVQLFLNCPRCFYLKNKLNVQTKRGRRSLTSTYHYSYKIISEATLFVLTITCQNFC